MNNSNKYTFTISMIALLFSAFAVLSGTQGTKADSQPAPVNNYTYNYDYGDCCTSCDVPTVGFDVLIDPSLHEPIVTPVSRPVEPTEPEPTIEPTESVAPTPVVTATPNPTSTPEVCKPGNGKNRRNCHDGPPGNPGNNKTPR